MNKPLIPLAKPDFDHREVDAVRRVLESGWVVQGPEVEAFEAAVAALHQAPHCIAVSSGTAALHLCYLALGIGPGDAVFVPSFAWPSAANAAMVVGARPVFVDVFPDTYNINPDSLRHEIERSGEHAWGRPRAVVPVHEFGLPVDVEAVLRVARDHKLLVIEDAACALGATYRGRPVGTFGSLGIFSFHPRKAATTGEGGAIVTHDDELARRCRILRNHGQDDVDGRRDFVFAGLNYRLTEIQAAIGRVQLEKFPEILERRRELAAEYRRQLTGYPAINLPADNPEHTWQTFMVVLDDALDRSDVVRQLAAAGVAAGPGAVSGHVMTVYGQQLGYQPKMLPVSARLHDQGLALPMHSFLDSEELGRCASALAT